MYFARAGNFEQFIAIYGQYNIYSHDINAASSLCEYRGNLRTIAFFRAEAGDKSRGVTPTRMISDRQARKFGFGFSLQKFKSGLAGVVVLYAMKFALPEAALSILA